MSFPQSNYPIGATWTCVDKQGRHGWIKLARRDGNIEMWTYGYSWSDGSGIQFDWATSYRKARELHWVTGKFKRKK